MTFGELVARSNQIAHSLHTRRIGRGDFVGVGLHRSLELPAVLLGILKSGAAYVPIDPGYPAARIEQMIASATLKCVLTTTSLAGCFSGVETIRIEDEALASESTVDLELKIEKDDLIYAIFTSGSTGKPKAASVYHRGFGNLLDWFTTELDLGPCDRTLLISSPSFDLTQKNFFAPLITGGTLILDEGRTFDLTRISGLIREHGITLINCTPSAFYPIVDAAARNSFSALSSLRFAVLGGEPISSSQLRPWLEHPNCQAEVVNTYGPTECTDICAYHKLHRANLDDHEFVPLGREIPNVAVTIVDKSLAPLPDGELGELCISGAGLGAGYLNDSLRTANAFTNSIYRTGDLARRLPSGILEFRGRADHQVKVNGFRIELGEIEITLSRHAEVREAIAMVSSDRLIAYVRGDAEPTDLRHFLSNHLPAYMVPGEIIRVDEFPLTPNGKVDRNALAAPAKTGSAPNDSDRPMEARVLALWSEILDRPISDPLANFFDLGGNSIHLAIVHVRLLEMTTQQFPITALFALPNARSIASFLAPKSQNSSAPTALTRAGKARASFSNFRPTISR